MALKVKADANPNPKPKLKAESKSATPFQAVSPVQPEVLPQAVLSRESEVEEESLIGDFTPENLIHGVVMAEILGKPRSRGRRF
jgi:hypothetical protein